MWQEHLRTLRRYMLPATIVLGVFLLATTTGYHRSATRAAQLYVETGFAFLFTGIFAAAAGATPPLFSRRVWWGIRVAGIATVLLTVAVYQGAVRTPIPALWLIAFAVLLTVSLWAEAKTK